MAVTVASGISTPGANTQTANLVSLDYEFIGPGTVSIVAKSSATGIYAYLAVGGVLVCNDQLIPFTGTAGTLDMMSNVMASQQVKGGRVVFRLFNKTGTAGTTADYLVLFTPSKG